MTIPELPQDIIDTIVQAFAKIILSDKEQLKKLCLVSHAFAAQSQRCIFHTISLLRDGYRDPNPPYHPFGERINILGRKLYALLQTSPHLFAYIRVLKIHAWSSAELAWVASMGEEAAAIIRACLALQTLELGSESPIEWTVMHPSLQTSLTSLIQSTQLNDLTLINVKDIPHFLVFAVGSLRTLRLECVSFSNPEPQNQGRLGIRPHRPLKHLCIAESNMVIRLLLEEKILSSELITLDIKYGHDGEDPSLVNDLLHKVHGIQEFHFVLLPNALDGLKSITVNPLRNLCRISILTRPDILDETYFFMKHVIRTSTILESANVMLTMLDQDWWNWSCLDALHHWTDFDYPESPFQQLTLSFIVPQSRDAETVHTYFSLNASFEQRLSRILGPDGIGTQVLPHIIKGHLLVAYVFVNHNIVWSESLNIRRRTIDSSIGRVHWRTWNPLGQN